MRIYALYLVVALLSIYAYRHWYRSLCGLMLLMAVIEHPDMPKSIMGIQGLNPWNILLFNVILGWLISRRREGLVWDMPRYMNVLLALYLLVVLVGFFRMMMDRQHLEGFTTVQLTSEYLINTVKWVVPGLLLFDGCRSRRRLQIALASVLAMYFLLAVQVIRWMPPSAAVSGAGLEHRSRKIILNEIGYHRGLPGPFSRPCPCCGGARTRRWSSRRSWQSLMPRRLPRAEWATQLGAWWG